MKRTTLAIITGVLLLLLSGGIALAVPSDQVVITSTPEYPEGKVTFVLPLNLAYTHSYLCTHENSCYICGDELSPVLYGTFEVNGKIYEYKATFEIKQKGGD